MSTNTPKSDKEKYKKVNPAMKYGGLGMQMAITIGLGVWLGGKLDVYFGTSKPYFTVALAILFLATVMFSLVREVSSDS